MKMIEIERSIVAAMMADEDCLIASSKLSDEDFQGKITREIFKACQRLAKKGKNVDPLTVYTELNEEVSLTEITTLSTANYLAANFNQYAEVLKEHTLNRKLKKVGQAILSSELKGEELASHVEQEVFNIRDSTSSGEFTNMDDLVMDTFTYIEEVHKGNVDRGIKTGFTDIDKVVGGLRKGEYILLAARPSMGKTALALNIAERVARDDKSVAIFSYEMGKQQLTERLISSCGKVELYKENTDWQRIIDASGYLGTRKISVIDDPRITVGEALSLSRKLKRQQGLDLIIIDYLQKIPSKVKGDARHKIEDVSNNLKNMAKLLGVPVLVVSSLSRGSEQRENKVPMMSDLRESGQIEFDADVIMFLHRDYYYTKDESERNLAELHVAKNRNGGLGKIDLIWQEQFTNFETMEWRDIC